MNHHYVLVPKRKSWSIVVAALLLLLTGNVSAQTSYSFTPAGATGNTGPNQAAVSTFYASTNLSGSVTVIGNGVQQFTVPSTGLYRIRAVGASGGSVNVSCSSLGGYGADMSGDFNLTAGQVLLVLVGQKGVSNNSDAGGGGGSFVTTSASVALVVGGGGGGASNNIGSCGSNLLGVNASTTTSGTTGAGGAGTGGTGGGGGTLANGGSAGGGGGFTGNGTGNGAGFAFMNGALGGVGLSGNDNGGYGGGGSGWSTGGNGGGGGGYSGGGTSGSLPYTGGGGGGSFNSGANQTNSISAVQGNGLVVISSLCNITLASTSTLICSGSSATLTTNAVSNYSWSTGATTSSIVVSPTVNTIYTLAATSPSACVATNSILIVVNNNPTVTASVNTPTVCSGRTVTFTASGANSYTWTNGITSGASYTATSSGDFTVTGTNACGTSTAVASLTVLALPSVSATASTPSVCSGNSVVITATGGTGYTINPNVGINTTFTPLTTNNYSVTGSGANGCTAVSVVNVLVINTPTIAPVATPTAICAGSTATISATGATGYTWAATNFGGSNQASVAVTPTITTTYTLNRANGVCTSTALLNVVVNNLPVLVITPPATVCACTGGTTLTAVGAITYTWFPSGAQGGVLSVFPCNTTNYTVGATNNFCTTYSTVLITTSPNPTITISANTPSVCFGNTVSLTASGAPNFSWTSVPNGGPYPNTATIVDTPPNSRLYTAAGTSTAGCTTQASQVVLVYPNPSITVTSSNSFVCNGGSTNLSATNATNTPTTYSWSNNGATTPSIIVSPTLSTNYTVTATYTTGCKTTSVYPLTVYIATFAVTTPSAVCSGVSNTLIANGAALGYTWTTTPPQTGSTAVVAPTVTTVYTVTGVNGQCSATRTVTVPVNPLPPVQIQAPKWVICLFEEIELTAAGATSYTWNGTDVTPSITFSASGNGGPNGVPTISTTFTLTGRDNNGCVKTTTATVFVANCTGIDEQNQALNELQVFPNPNAGIFTVKSSKPLELAIVNELGQHVQTLQLTAMEQEVSVAGLPNGIYYIMGQDNGRIIAKKLVISK